VLIIVTKLHKNFLLNFLNVMKRVFDVMKGEYNIIIAEFYVKIEAFNTALAKILSDDLDLLNSKQSKI
jgi:uncharacterized protein YaiL (DUF2058 family)